MIRYFHGGDVYSRRVDYDFSANINPLGMPERVRKILAERVRDYERYPDPCCSELVSKIAEREGVPADKIVCGNGAADIIYRIAYALKPSSALIAVPTFSEYEKALLSAGCKIKLHPLDEGNEFELQEDIIGKIKGCDIVFLCNPNNPTGKLIPRELMEDIIEKCASENCTAVIDECFMDFSDKNKKYSVFDLKNICDFKNIIVIKAFTKIYAMAGLRLGCAICADEKNAEKIKLCGQCWSVSSPAQIAGIAALEEKAYIEKTAALIAEERAFLSNSLKNMGLKVYSSEANFILFRCGMPLDKMLIDKRIAVRSCNDFHGLERGFFRIAVRTHDENTVLINALREVLQNG